MPSIINATTTNGLSTSADNSGELQLATNNGTTAVTITTAQNVGIGTALPSAFDAKLAVFNGNIALSSTTNKLYLYYVSATNNAYLSTASDGSITFANGTSSPTERMRITPIGQVTLTRPTGDDTQIDFLRMQGGGASAGDNLAFLSKYTTTVSTSTKNIFGGPPRGCIVVVTGYTGASYFSDILNCSSNSVSVISSQNSTGSPASRTYSISSFLLSLSMGSGTYNVGTLLLGTTPRE